MTEQHWGTHELRRYYARQARREALMAERGLGFYKTCSQSERDRTADLLREVAAGHRRAAKLLRA